MGIISKRLKWSEITAGVPQGAVLSLLLANYYLHPFDQCITSHTGHYVRYADVFLSFSENQEETEELVRLATEFLKMRLRLKLNQPVVAEIKNGIPFWGVIVRKSGVSVTEEKKQKLQDKVQTRCFTCLSVRKTSFCLRYY